MEYFEIPKPDSLVPGSEEEYQLMNLFLDFWLIKFPEDRVRLLLELFNEDYSHTFNCFSSKAIAFELVRKTSIKKVRKLFNANRAFQLICTEFHKLSPNITNENKDKIRSIIHKLY